jgi:hypothetical protein
LKEKARRRRRKKVFGGEKKREKVLRRHLVFPLLLPASLGSAARKIFFPFTILIQ